MEAEAGPARPVEAEAGYGGGVGTEMSRPGVCHSPDAALAPRTNTNSTHLLYMSVNSIGTIIYEEIMKPKYVIWSIETKQLTLFGNGGRETKKTEGKGRKGRSCWRVCVCVGGRVYMVIGKYMGTQACV